MRRLLMAVFALVLLTSFHTRPARSQYMYLDSNGDGIHTAADKLNFNSPTTADVWIDTDNNRDGSPAVCSSGDGAFTINSYVVNLAASNGTVAYSGFINRRPEASTTLVPFASNTTEMTVGWGGGFINPPATYRLFTVTITRTAGNPAVAIVGPSGLQPTDVTSFGSQCSGNDFDNTLKLGSDWFNADGLGATIIDSAPPVITAPATASAVANASVTITGSATDPDVNLVTLSQTNNTPFFPASSSAGPVLNPSISLSATPTFAQRGSFTIQWSAQDDQSATAAATTALHVGPDGNIQPIITAPATLNGGVNNPITVTGSASDPDGNLVTLSQTNNAAFLAGPASAGPLLNPSITLAGTPNFSQSGSYTINWSAIDNGTPSQSATATTAIVVGSPGRPPVITAPATVHFISNNPGSVTGSASDPDAQNVTLSQSTNAPFFPSSSSSGPSLNPSITLSGTPNFSQDGSYSISWLAIDSGSPSSSANATTSITVGSNRNPVIAVAATATGTEGSPVSITATAADPDAQQVTLCVNSKPAFMTGGPCAGPAPNPSLTITGTPGPNDAGNYAISWSATDGIGGTSTAITALAITNSNRPPTLAQPADMNVDEGAFASQSVAASDPDNDPLIFGTVGTAPLFVAVSGNPTGPCNITASPGYADAGSYTVTIRASDGVLFDTKSFAITVRDINRCPTSDPGGPYSGVIGSPITFDGSGTSDPDGDPVTFAWDFGDGSTGAGAVIQHTYAANGIFTITFTVSDGTCTESATQEVSIAASHATNAFAVGGNDVTSLNAGKPFTCIQLEPVGGSFDVADVYIATIRMVSLGTGSVPSIQVDFNKSTIGADKDRDGISEITACFRKEDLRQLFSGLPSGRNTVDVQITGTLTTGGIFSANFTMTVKATGGALAAAISPNPLNPSAKLSFATTKPGAVRVQLFDLSGRLVRTLLDEPQAAAGWHDLTIDGRGPNGARLTSGVYFVKIHSQYDGEETRSLTVLK